MEVSISLSSPPTPGASVAIAELASEFRRRDLEPSVKSTESPPGTKELTLAIGISLAGLAIGAVPALIGVLAFWRSSRPSYSVIVRRGEVEISVGNLDAEDVERVVHELTDVENDDTDIEVRISDES